MSATTSIHELPIDPAGGNDSPNVQLNVNEAQPPIPPQQPPQQPPQHGPQMTTTLDKESINSIVTGLQQASASGATQLMSRDMPNTSHHIAQDEQVQPNFIPEPEKTEDYLEDQEDDDDILNAYNSKVQKETQMDKLYEDLQTPIMLAILFFIFQLPFLKKQLFVFVPALFMNDGNYNLYGFIVISVLYATTYHMISKGLALFNTF
jgi:hypothetical protein